MRHILALASAAAAVLAFAPVAQANSVSVTYQGVVDATQTLPSGIVLPTPDFDVADLFGGGNLEGDSVTAVVDYDTSRGLFTGAPGFADLTGGAALYDQVTGIGYRSPILSESFTINGYNYSFTPDYYADLETQSGPKGYVQQIATDEAGASSILSYSTSAAPGRLDYSFSTQTGFGAGYLLTDFGPDNVSDNVQLALTDVQVSAAPEPSSWALMLLGVGLCGATFRRRSRVRAVGCAA